MDYCKQCGTQKRREADRVCTNCGSPFLKNLVEQISVKEEAPIKRRSATERRATKQQSGPLFKWIMGTAAFIAIFVVALVGYFYAKETYGMEAFVDQAGKAIRNQDTVVLKDIIKKEGNILISSEEAKKFAADVEDSSSIQKKILASLDEQREALEKGGKREPFVLKLQESSQKKWFVIPQYELVLVPVKLEFSVPSGSRVSIGNQKAEVDENGEVSVKDLLPGIYPVKLDQASENTETKVEAWTSSEMNTASLEAMVEEFAQNEEEATDYGTTNMDSTDSSEASLDSLQTFIDDYLHASVRTFNERDIEYVKFYTEPNSEGLKNLSDYLVTLSKRGIYEELLNAEVLHYEEVSENVYDVTVFSKYNISFNNGETRRYQTYNAVYRVVKNDGRFLCRKVMKEELVEKKDI